LRGLGSDRRADLTCIATELRHPGTKTADTPGGTRRQRTGTADDV